VAFVFPTYEQIVEANNRIIGRYGGSGHQVLNGGPLHYAIECIEHSVFGVELHPTIVEKACKLAHQIVTSHVFIDGNKRTAFKKGPPAEGVGGRHCLDVRAHG
jgi:death-on-curing protein